MNRYFEMPRPCSEATAAAASRNCMSKDGPIADYELVSGFELARSKLLTPDFADCLDKPLAFWAMPSDRRLPLALMAKPLGELLATPLAKPVCHSRHRPQKNPHDDRVARPRQPPRRRRPASVAHRATDNGQPLERSSSGRRVADVRDDRDLAS